MADENYEDFDSIPGLSDEELAALEQERTMMEETEAQMASRLFRETLVPAVQSLKSIALHSANPRLRLQAAQYIIERNLGRVQDTPPAPANDPFKELLAECVKEVDGHANGNAA